MYPIDREKWENMLNRRKVVSRMEIELDDHVHQVTIKDADIIKDSYTQNARATNNADFNLGATYAASLAFSSFITMREMISGEYLKVTPTVFYDVDGEELEIPLGVFYCDTPTEFVKTTSYQCYDGMIKLDKPVQTRVIALPYQLLLYICNTCEVHFGNTSEDILEMPNGALHYAIDPEQVDTYRTAVSLIAKMLGGFVQFGRDGKLYVRQFHKTPDVTIPRSVRTQSSLAGYRTRFSGVQCRFLAQQNFYPYKYIDSTRTGIIVDLGDIPIVEDTDTVKNNIVRTLYEQVLSQLEYYPCTLDMVGDPTLDVGDMIQSADRHGYLRKMLLTSITYNWHRASQVVSEGTDPKLNSVSTAEKRAAQREEQNQSQSEVTIATYVNALPLYFDDDEDKEITSLRFITNKDLTAIFGAEIPIYSDGEGYVEITYYNSNIEGDKVTARLHEGWNLVTLANHLFYYTNSVVNLTLRAKIEGIDGGEAPEARIDQDTIRSYIFAQGISTEVSWDGIIVLSETIPAYTPSVVFASMSDALELILYQDAGAALSAIITAFQSRMQTENLTESVSFVFSYLDSVNFCGENYYAGTEGVLL